MNVKTGFVGLTGHTGVLPATADSGRVDQVDLSLTKTPFSQAIAGAAPDISWSIRGDQDNAWECDFGSNNSVFDTIHRIWMR